MFKMNPSQLAEKSDQAASLLAAMANPSRLMVLCHLIDGELTVGALADRVGLNQSPLSQHLARLRALTRRGRTHQLDESLSYGPIVLHSATHLVAAAGQPLELSATEYRLIEHLLRHPEVIVSRDQLAEHVWGGDYDPFSNVADVYIGYLRRKLRAAGLDQPLVHTIRGMGYMLKTRPAGGQG